MADGTGHVAHVALVLVPRVVAVGVLVPALEERHARPRTRRSSCARGRSGSCSGRAPGPATRAARPSATLAGSRSHGVSIEKPSCWDEAGEQPGKYSLLIEPAHGATAPCAEALLRVGDDELGVDLLAGADAGALGAGAEGRVERERPRLERLEGQPVVDAGEVLGEGALAVRVVLVEVDEVEDDEAAGQAERGLDRVGEPALGALLDREPVDDHLDRVLLLLLELRRLGQRVDDAVDPDAGEALGLQGAEQVDVLALAGADDRGEHLEAGALLHAEHLVDDLLRRLPGDRLAAVRAVRLAGAGVEQAEVVVDLGDRADGRPRVAVGRLLVDRDGRRQALDEVDVGLVHLPEELAGVGRQRLDVAALALGEDRVEGQAGLARAGEPREDDQRVAGQVEVDVLEVVLAGAADDEPVHVIPVSRCG